MSAPIAVQSAAEVEAAAAAAPLTLTFELHPACRLHVAYFLGVRNAAALKAQMLAGRLRAALLDATAVCGVRQVRACAVGPRSTKHTPVGCRSLYSVVPDVSLSVWRHFHQTCCQ
jgi:hypothetical protein